MRFPYDVKSRIMQPHYNFLARRLLNKHRIPNYIVIPLIMTSYVMSHTIHDEMTFKRLLTIALVVFLRGYKFIFEIRHSRYDFGNGPCSLFQFVASCSSFFPHFEKILFSFSHPK